MRHIPIYINPERHPELEPGEWQTDETGRRFRMIGNCKEYEPEINGVPQSVFFASQKAQKEADRIAREKEQKEAAERAARRRNCPFIDSNGRNTDCSREACALFIGESCTLARLTPAKDTEGLQCPFDRYKHKCRKDCALYRNGCTLTGIKESEDK